MGRSNGVIAAGVFSTPTAECVEWLDTMYREVGPTLHPPDLVQVSYLKDDESRYLVDARIDPGQLADEVSARCVYGPDWITKPHGELVRVINHLINLYATVEITSEQAQHGLRTNLAAGREVIADALVACGVKGVLSRAREGRVGRERLLSLGSSEFMDQAQRVSSRIFASNAWANRPHDVLQGMTILDSANQFHPVPVAERRTRRR